MKPFRYLFLSLCLSLFLSLPAFAGSQARGGGGGVGAIFSVMNTAGVGVNTSSTAFHTFTYPAGTTSGGALAFSTTESLRQMVMPVPCTLSKFFVQTSTAQPADGDLVLTVRINGSDTGVTITIPASGAAGTFSDTTHSASVAAGDLISFSGANASATGGATFTRWAINAR